MTLSGFRVLDKSGVVCFLFVVSGKRGPQGGKLLVGFQPAEALVGFVHGRSSPAQGHRGGAPALHIAGDATHGAHHIFDDVGAGQRAPQLCRQTEPAHREDLIQSLEDALRDAEKAEKLIRNLAQRLERDAPGVSKSILEGLDEILTVSRLGLPAELRRSLACTNIIENMMGTVRRVTRNVKRWSSPSMALRWTAAAMHEAKKGFRRLKAFKQLPALRAALAAHYEKETNSHAVAQNAKAA